MSAQADVTFVGIGELGIDGPLCVDGFLEKGEMMELMERPLDPPRKGENQVTEFIGEALPAGSKLWSKAGWTSEVRHDAAYIELPSGKKWVVVIETRGVADDKTTLPSIARLLLPSLQ